MGPAYALIGWEVGGEARAAPVMTALAAAPGWRLQSCCDRAALYIGPGSVCRLSGALTDGLVLIGDLFSRRDGARLDATPLAGDRAGGRAAALAAAGFGRYVAVLASPDGAPAVFRDPSGGIEALTWRSGGLTVVASGLDDVVLHAAPADLSLDWARIAHYAHHPTSLGVGSGFLAVHAIDPGALGGFQGERFVQTPIWRPGAFVRPARLCDAAAGDALREAVERAVAVYSDQRAIAEISGGLDSAIVAQVRVKATAETQWNAYFAEGEADERPYARAVADHLGIRLVEIASPREAFDVGQVAEGAVGPRPSLNGLDAHMDIGARARALAFGADALLTGQGGDAVLFRSRTALVLADALFERVPPDRLAPLLLNLARWTRRSVWAVGRDAVAARLRRGAATGGDDSFHHAWLDLPAKTPPGKRLHVRQVLAAQAFNAWSRRGSVAKLVHPLLSQPVVELCLSLPTYQLTQGRRDRALAREAFARRLPPVTVERRSKGDMTRHYGQMIARSLSDLRPFLLEGRLVAAGLLDRSRLERQLTPDDLIARGDFAAILQWMAVEAWVQHWASWS